MREKQGLIGFLQPQRQDQSAERAPDERPDRFVFAPTHVSIGTI
jgi:hypothetical protein